MKHFLASLVALGAAAAARGQTTNIDQDYKHSFGENIGFMNWRDADSTNGGVHVYPTHLTGAIWCENVGWIFVGSGPADTNQYANADAADYGVNVSPGGKLFGFGWGENIGWVNFGGGAEADPSQPAYLDSSVSPRRLYGYVWGENVGWINLDDDKTYVGVYCFADVIADGFVTGEDFDLFVEAFELGDPGADINGDSFVTGEDFDQFVAAFEAGC
ncbi:MAG: hypothetical protein IT304_12590 [Dehalococcoidia bacterium]|nr:hypothetical protein [Dehalococcoidia bacterium]